MAKKPKTVYDADGRWVEEKNRIKGAMRRTFRLSPQMKEVLEQARVELPPLPKKDGTPGKRPQVKYRCAICKQLFSRTQVQVDHIKPVVPLNKKESDMSYDELADGIFCKKDNLQVVCSIPLKKNNDEPSCHKIKTDEENWIRSTINGRVLATTEAGWDLVISDYKKKYEVIKKEKDEQRAKKRARKARRKDF